MFFSSSLQLKSGLLIDPLYLETKISKMNNNTQKALEAINEKLDNIEKYSMLSIPDNDDKILSLLEEIKLNTLLSAKNVLNIHDVKKITGLSKSHLYKLSMKNGIPHYKPSGKLLYFDRKEIEQWMKRGRVATQEEMEHAATEHCFYNKKGCRR